MRRGSYYTTTQLRVFKQSYMKSRMLLQRLCSSQINICCTAGAAGDSLPNHTNFTSSIPSTFTVLLSSVPQMVTRTPPASPPLLFSGHIAPKTTIVWPRTTPVSPNAPRGPPAPPSSRTCTSFHPTQLQKHPPHTPHLGRRCGRLRANGQFNPFYGYHRRVFDQNSEQTSKLRPPPSFFSTPSTICTF